VKSNQTRKRKIILKSKEKLCFERKCALLNIAQRSKKIQIVKCALDL